MSVRSRRGSYSSLSDSVEEQESHIEEHWGFANKNALIGPDNEEESLDITASGLLRLATVHIEEEQSEESKMSGSSSKASTPKGSDWLDGNSPLSVGHTVDQVVSLYSSFLHAECKKLMKIEFLKLKIQAKEGLTKKFVLMKSVMDSKNELDIDKLKTIYLVSICTEEFCQALCQSDMEHMFTKIPDEFM